MVNFSFYFLRYYCFLKYLDQLFIFIIITQSINFITFMLSLSAAAVAAVLIITTTMKLKNQEKDPPVQKRLIKNLYLCFKAVVMITNLRQLISNLMGPVIS